MIDVVYLAHNRLAFTKVSFRLLLKNTDWRLVDRLIVYDDNSEDGTAAYLEKACAKVLEPLCEFIPIGFGSPVATMNDYLATSTADLFAKIDNDIAVPPQWLNKMATVMEEHPELELLGMEAGRTRLNGRDGVTTMGYTYEPCSHIGGVGLMRTSAFHSRPAVQARGRFGFTEWQARHEPVRGWIAPDLLVPQLDRIPALPWSELSAEYVAKGWQREWRAMDPSWCRPYYEWLPKSRVKR